jgi:hypothetical protein
MIVTREMPDFLAETKGLTREDAYMLASVAMDLLVTQVVDITKGIHALIPKAIFDSSRQLAHRRNSCARKRHTHARSSAAVLPLLQTVFRRNTDVLPPLPG